MDKRRSTASSLWIRAAPRPMRSGSGGVIFCNLIATRLAASASRASAARATPTGLLSPNTPPPICRRWGTSSRRAFRSGERIRSANDPRRWGRAFQNFRPCVGSKPQMRHRYMRVIILAPKFHILIPPAFGRTLAEIDRPACFAFAHRPPRRSQSLAGGPPSPKTHRPFVSLLHVDGSAIRRLAATSL